MVVSGPEEMRKAVRMFLKYGVDTIKLNLSGDNFAAARRGRDHLDERRGSRHGRARDQAARQARAVPCPLAANSIKQALRHGIEIIYHASFTDEEALDLLEASKDKIFVAPGIAVLFAMTAPRRLPWGIDRKQAIEMGYEIEIAAAVEMLKKMHKRGIRVLPGGDYGFAWHAAWRQRHATSSTS